VSLSAYREMNLNGHRHNSNGVLSSTKKKHKHNKRTRKLRKQEKIYTLHDESS